MTPIDLVKEVKRILCDTGMTQKEVSAITGVPLPTIYKILHRKMTPRVDTVLGILDPLGYELVIRRKS